MERKLKEMISKIPSEGWWNSSNEETFQSISKRLLNKGLKVEEIIDILEDCYVAVSSEYGN